MESFDFRLSHGPKALPAAFESLHAAALGDHLDVVGLDEVRRTRLLGVDARGEVIGTGIELPLVEVTGLTACGGTMVVAGVTAGDSAVILGVSVDGQVIWRADVSAGGRFQHWPRPVCAAGSTWLFSTTGGAHGAIQLIQVVAGRLGAPVVLALTDDSDAVDVLGDTEGILVARIHANGQRLELMRVAGSRVTARINIETVRPAAPSLARVGDAIALAWVTAPSESRIQWFDAQFNPLGASKVLTAPLGATIDSVRLLVSLDGALAVALRTREVVGDASTVHNPNGTVTHRAPRRALPLWIAAYDNETHRLGPLHSIDADAKLYAIDWLDTALVVVHGGRETRLSIFERNMQGTRGALEVMRTRRI